MAGQEACLGLVRAWFIESGLGHDMRAVHPARDGSDVGSAEVSGGHPGTPETWPSVRKFPT
jgi:hypothetical protein